MKTLNALLIGTALVTLSACASIIEGSTDQINLSTNPPSNSVCTLTSKRGSYTVTTPAIASVKKSRSDMNVSCSDPRTGAQGKTAIVSDVEPWAFGNILLGGIIGLGVDWGTGAAYDYPDSAVVPVAAPVATAPMLDPSQTMYAPQPTAAVAPTPTAAQPVAAAPVYQQPAAQPAYQQMQPAAGTTYYAPAPAPAPAAVAPAPQAAPRYEYIPPSQLTAPATR